MIQDLALKIAYVIWNRAPAESRLWDGCSVRLCANADVRGIVLDGVYGATNASRGVLWPQITHQWLVEPPSEGEVMATLRGLGVRAAGAKALAMAVFDELGHAANRLEGLARDEYKRNKHGAHDKATRVQSLEAASVTNREGITNASSVYAYRGGLSALGDTCPRLENTLRRATGPTLASFQRTVGTVAGVVAALTANRIELGGVFASATAAMPTSLASGVDQLPSSCDVSFALGAGARATASWVVRTEVFECVPVPPLRDRRAATFIVRGSPLRLAPSLPPVGLVGAADGGVRGQGGCRSVESLTAASGAYVRVLDTTASPRHVALGIAFKGCSNNVAEALALTMTLEAAIGAVTCADALNDHGDDFSTIYITIDSELIFNLITGNWACSDATLLWVRDAVRHRIATLWQLQVVVVLEHVLRAFNKRADGIVNIVADAAARRPVAQGQPAAGDTLFWLHPQSDDAVASLLTCAATRDAATMDDGGAELALPKLGCGIPATLTREPPTVAELKRRATARRREEAAAARAKVAADKAAVAERRRAEAAAVRANEAAEAERRRKEREDARAKAAAEKAAAAERRREERAAKAAAAERRAAEAVKERERMAAEQRERARAIVEVSRKDKSGVRDTVAPRYFKPLRIPSTKSPF